MKRCIDRTVVAFLEAQRQIELGERRARRQLRHAHIGERRQRTPRAISGHHLKQRMMTRAAHDAERFDHLLERHVLMRLRIDERACCVASTSAANGCVASTARRERQRVDEEADRDPPSPPRSRFAAGTPIWICVSPDARAKQRIECREQHGKRRRAACIGEAPSRAARAPHRA